jgi:hypothetical protein
VPKAETRPIPVTTTSIAKPILDFRFWIKRRIRLDDFRFWIKKG